MIRAPVAGPLMCVAVLTACFPGGPQRAEAQQRERTTFPIDAKKEPLGAALQRLNLPGAVGKMALRIDSEKSFKLLRRDDDGDPVYQHKTMKGRDVREDFCCLKAGSIDDELDAKSRNIAKEAIANALKKTAARKERDGKLPRYPLDPKKEEFSAMFVKYFTPEEKEYFESIDPDKDFKIMIKDKAGNPVPQIDTLTGIELRNTCWLVMAFADRAQQDAKVMELLNRRLYGTPKAPAEGSKAEEAAAEIMDSALKVVQAVEDYGDLSIRLTDDDINDLESSKKEFANDLIKAGLWTKDSDEYKHCLKYAAKAKLVIPVYDHKRKVFLDVTFPITGAEHSHAMAALKAYANVSKLDDEARKRVNLEFFKQETRPEKSADRYKRGLEKVHRLLNIIQGEAETAGK